MIFSFIFEMLVIKECSMCANKYISYSFIHEIFKNTLRIYL